MHGLTSNALKTKVNKMAVTMNALEKRVRPDVHGLIQGSNSLNVEKKHLTQINKIALASCIQCGAKCFLEALK